MSNATRTTSTTTLAAVSEGGKAPPSCEMIVEVELVMKWSSITAKILRPVLLYTQANRTDIARTWMKKK